MCLYPKFMYNKKYTANKKNGGQVPPFRDRRVLYVPVKCGKCMECKKMKARNWQVRLQEEIKQNKNGKFITLTFSNEEYTKLWEEQSKKGYKGYDLDNAIATLAVRRWLERYRKDKKKSIRHWLVTELGHNGTEHLHMHGIIWTNESLDYIEEKWKYGYMWKGKRKPSGTMENYVNEATINYMIKYVTKIDLHHKEYNSIILTSKGIGSNYTNSQRAINNKYKDGETNETYKTNTGNKIQLPIYYRNKIYTEIEREDLWLDKLDKGIRYINGEKVKTDEAYLKLVEYYRNLNKQLGYGGEQTDIERKEYENQLRTIKQLERKNRD